MTDTTPEATAEGTTTEPTGTEPESAVLTADDVDVAKHIGDIAGSDKGTDPGRLSIEIGLYDPSDPESSRFASVEVPEGIHTLGEFALAFGLNAAELRGANGDDNVKTGDVVRVPKTLKPVSLETSPADRPDYNESGATHAEVDEIHEARDEDVATTGGTATPEVADAPATDEAAPATENGQ